MTLTSTVDSIIGKVNTATSHIASSSNPHSVTKTQVGLSNVDNTSDANKPVSTATQTALNLKANQSTTYTKIEVDAAISGLVDSAPLTLNTLNELAAALGDDANFATTVNTSLGTKVDKTITVNGHALSGNVTVTKSDVSLGNVDNTSDANKPVSTAQATAIAGKQPLDADLTAIAGLAGTTGLLKKTAADTWTLDTSAYVTSSGVTSVTGTAPIASSGGSTPAISITAATSSAAGSMSSADKTKLDGITSGATANTGTVTSVATSGAITGGTITTSGTISHSTADGYLHIPATGTTNNGKFLQAGATAGSVSWVNASEVIGIADLNNVAITSPATNQGIIYNGTSWVNGNGIASSCTGNATTATTLQTARTINGVSFNGSANITIPAGATGAGSDKIFFENGQTVTTSYSITAGMNAMTAGNVTINSGVTVTVPTGSRWVIV